MNNYQYANQALMQGDTQSATAWALLHVGDTLGAILGHLDHIDNTLQANLDDNPETSSQEASQPTPVEDQLTHGSGDE